MRKARASVSSAAPQGHSVEGGAALESSAEQRREEVWLAHGRFPQDFLQWTGRRGCSPKREGSYLGALPWAAGLRGSGARWGRWLSGCCWK